MNIIQYVILIIISAFTMNLSLQCALGVKGAAGSKEYSKTSILIKSGIIFTAVILLWLFFSGIIFSFSSGIFIYVLLFPASFIFYEGLEFLIFCQILKKEAKDDCFTGFPGGITAVAVFICINLAENILGAAALSFGFTAGVLIVFLIIREISKRASLEAVPVFLRGKPLVIAAMGLLSLVFSAASLLLLRMISLK